MTSSGDLDQAEELLLRGLAEVEHVKRVRAAEQLGAMGIMASPADCEAWIAAPARQRRKLMETYLVWKTSYSRM